MLKSKNKYQSYLITNMTVRLKGPQEYKNHNACFVGKNNEMAVVGDSGGPILFEHFSQIYLYSITSMGGSLAELKHKHLLYVTTGTLIRKDDIKWMIKVGGIFVKSCVRY